MSVEGIRYTEASGFDLGTQPGDREEVLHLLTTHAPVGVFQTDPAGYLLRTNSRWRAMAGMAHVSAPRGLWWQMVHPADREKVLVQWKGALRHGSEFRSEFRVNLERPVERFTRTRIVLAYRLDGSVRNCIGVSEDVTEYRRLAAELGRAHMDLEHRVKERTAQLELANRELAQFAHVVAHDLKAPLRAVSHLADWLAADYAPKLDAKGHELFGLLRHRVQFMHQLIEGVLCYARLGQTEDPDVVVDLGKLVARVIDVLAPPPHVTFHLPSDLPQVAAPAERLYQVFQNLLDNAVKFMDKPHGEITLGAVRLRDGWQFAVSDNGPGIDPRYHGHVFGMFQRLGPLSSERSTGIGLALVKKIVEARGGKVVLDSALGEGATFRFTWPDRPPQSPTLGIPTPDSGR